MRTNPKILIQFVKWGGICLPKFESKSMNVIERLNSGISYLEDNGMYRIANTLYLAKETIKDSEVFCSNDSAGVTESFNKIAMIYGQLNFERSDYTSA